MTTKDSALHILKAQADRIAAAIKAAERGDKTNVRFAAKIEAARVSNESFKIGIVMDDKAITIEIPWATIRDADQADVSEYILGQMREEGESKP